MHNFSGRAKLDVGHQVVAFQERLDLVVSLREMGVSPEVIAQSLGRKTAWVEALLAVARDPVARILIRAGRLSSAEAWHQFVALDPAERKRFLDSAEPISSARCERAERERRNPHPRDVLT